MELARCLPVDTLLPDEASYRAAYRTLPEWRRKKCDAFRFAADRRRSVAVWLLARRLFGEIGFDDASAVVAENEYGKPYFVGKTSPHFSLSHAGDLVMAAVADRPIGCDVERIAPLLPGMAEHCLTEDELAHLDRSTDREREFYRLWVRKESALKALGSGFQYEPRELSVLSDLLPHGVTIRDFPPPADDYLAAVCDARPIAFLACNLRENLI